MHQLQARQDAQVSCWGYQLLLPTACLTKPLPTQSSSTPMQDPLQVFCSNKVTSNNWVSVLSICLSFSFHSHKPELE